MNLLEVAATVVRDMLVFVGAMTALLVMVLLAAARLPGGHPVKRLLLAVCVRLVATIAAGLIAVPIEPIPGLDVAYDIAAPLGLLIFWVTFFRKAAALVKTVKRVPAATGAGLLKK